MDRVGARDAVVTEHLDAAVNFPLDYINSNFSKLDRNETYYLHCGSGYRSLIAASILRARGFQNLVNVQGGWSEVKETSLPKSEFLCPTKMSQEVIDAAVAAAV